VDAANALADLAEISSQIEAAVVLDKDGAVTASTLDDAARAESIARVARDLLAAGDDLRSGERKLVQLEVALREGSVFVVRDQGASIAATTTPGPTSGLVFYDLKTCLRALAEKPAPKPRTRPAKKKAATDA
jgi:predicted regulator of Ras-like GTPase activity (Roadblock/LC7/MglB family)